jgi:hypothetical protein
MSIRVSSSAPSAHPGQAIGQRGMSDVLDKVRAAIAEPWTPPTDEEKYEQDRCRCHKCKRVMQEGEPVYRIRTYIGRGMFGGSRHGNEMFCRDCAGMIDAHSEGKCAHCSRLIFDCARHGWRQPRFYYCSHHCQRLGESARQTALISERRAAERGPSRECPVCHEVFETTRKHAQYCSGRCRQLSYRGRRALRF